MPSAVLIVVPTNRPVVNSDYPALEKVADMAIKEKQKFERLVVPKETLLEMFGVRHRYMRIYTEDG